MRFLMGLSALTLCVVAGTVDTAQAGTLYATNVYASVSQLYQVNTATGALTTIGQLHTAGGTNPITWGSALAFDTGGALWGVDGYTGWVGTINTSTALVTPVSAPASTTNSPGFISGLAFNPVTNALYALCESSWASGAVSGIYEVNKTTGVYSLLAPVSMSLSGMSYGGDGKLYGISYGSHQLYQIDPTTGALTPVGTATAPNSIRDIAAITDGPAGRFFAESDGLSGMGGQGLAEIVLGPTTTYTGIGPLSPSVGHIDGLAYLGDGDPVVPEPSGLALALGLGGVGLILARRRPRLA